MFSFYTLQFRKVNRERTFWIYKHNLFHRDRPEDLHLLRRRTCPGVDGRKNRFVAVGSRKSESEAVISQESSRTSSSDDSSDDVTSGDEESRPKSLRQKKRRAAAAAGAASKRSRRQSNEDAVDGDDVPLGEEEDKATEKADRCERLEQSLVVSQVAMKLEEYAKKAKQGISLSRTARARGGVVTPPTRSAFGYRPADSHGVLTYDDEAFDDDVQSQDGNDSPFKRLSRTSSSGTVVTDGDDILSIGDDGSSSFGAVVSESSTPVKTGAGSAFFESPPVDDLDMVKDVVGKILACSEREHDDHAPAFAAVIGFCMSTAPGAGDELFNKVFHLISSSDKLATEFHQYRAALHPLERSSDLLPPCVFATESRENRVIPVQQIWDRNADKIDAVREFKTFAVNYFHKVLLQKSSKVSFTESQVSALRYTVDAWLKSAC